jgi:hypothetical protein
MPETASIDSVKESKKGGQTDSEIWLERILHQRDVTEKDWRDAAEDAVNVYEAEGKNPSAFNMFHSNVETLLPAVHNSPPIPDVRRRFGDKSPVAKMTADIAERLLSESVDRYDLDNEILDIIRDGEVAGRGIPRIRMDVKTEGEGDNTRIVSRDVYLERYNWKKVILGPATSHRRRKWVAFELDLTRDELIALNPTKGKDLGLDLDTGPTGKTSGEEKSAGAFKTARVYEVWDKVKREVLFIADQDAKLPLKVLPDPLKLSWFFPILEPYVPIKRIRNDLPVVPWKVYKSLLGELDTNTKRIAKLIQQLRVKGLVASEAEEDLSRLRDADDGEYIAASEVAMFAQAGGLEKAMAHWPLEPIVKTLEQLYQQRELIKQTIYEVTGMSDIMRGATDPRETKGAQQIKSKWGSLRIQRRQTRAARISRDLFRAKTEIFANHYEPELISQITSLPGEQSDQEQQQLFVKGLQLLKSGLRSFNIDIETNSTIRADLTHSQEQMNLFLTGTAQFAQSMMGVVQLEKAMLPLVVEVFTAFARKFQLGKQAEDALDELQQNAPAMAAEMKRKEEQAQQQGGDGDAALKQLELQLAKVRAEAEQQKMQYDIKCKQLEAQMKEMEFASKQRDADLAQQNAAADAEVKALDLEIKRATLAGLESKAALEQTVAEFEMELKERQAVLDEDHRKAELALRTKEQAQRPKEANKPKVAKEKADG